MAIDFPSNPVLDQVYKDPLTEIEFKWNGYGWDAKPVPPSYSQEESDARFVHITGDLMKGVLYHPFTPTVPDHVANKRYVDMVIEMLPTPEEPGISQAAADARYVNITGDAMTGYLSLHALPTDPMHASTKQYVDQAIAAIPPPAQSGISQGDADARYVNITGDTMSGGLQINSNLGVAGRTDTNYISNVGDMDNSGQMRMNTIVCASSSTFNGHMFSNYGRFSMFANNNPCVQLFHSTGASFGLWSTQGPDFYMAMGNTDGNGNSLDAMWWVNGAKVQAWSNQAYKPAGGAWFASSDARIKNVLGNYEGGLAQILSIQPVRYKYRGNDTARVPEHHVDLDENHNRMPTPQTPPVAPYGNSPHYMVAIADKEFIGLVAQDVETIMPEMIVINPGMIDGVLVSDLRDIDSSALTYALINAVKELNAKIEALEAQLAARS